MQSIRFGLPVLLGLLWLPAGAVAQPRVVASILPVHSLVAAVMQDAGEPELLIRGGSSPHDYALRPSDLRAISDAGVVFWIGPALESFLVRPLESAGKTRSAPLLETPELEPLPLREGGLWDAHDHTHDEHEHAESAGHDRGHGHADLDPHVWLDPRRAGMLAQRIAAVLGEIDPANRAVYQRNSTALRDRLEQLEQEIDVLLEPVRTTPYVVFHDAYQYFEQRFGTNAVGSLTLSPERSPGARRISEIRARIVDRGARCVFREPQFEPALIATLLEGTEARAGVLDPLGAELAPGPGAYPMLLRTLAEALRNCLE
jgi:zinc transport system substrate-binding protein